MLFDEPYFKVRSCLVDLVEEWEDIARYTRYLPENIRAGSSYQLRKAEDSVEIKVRVCKYGYTKKFKNDEDPEPSTDDLSDSVKIFE
jgi:hypothetical protein